jgi:NAD(P)-dependent dehydrogenase (short-subunit alcohol dehydrogenase family)
LKAIIVSATSGIGEELCKSWVKKGWKVFGTYRSHSSVVETLEDEYGIPLVQCDLASVSSIQNACNQLKLICDEWDVLVFAAGTLDPIGPFETTDFEEWERSLQVNFTQQMRILHSLLPVRNKSSQRPSVLFFAGGGTNNAANNYSSYAISKIALTKMCEFLDAEISDTNFSIVGPGWVKTKIHESTLKAGRDRAGVNFDRTKDKLEAADWVLMDRVIECCTWIVTTQSNGVKGRNFSVAHDHFGTRELEKALENDPDMYKLRRNKNFWTPLQDKS